MKPKVSKCSPNREQFKADRLFVKKKASNIYRNRRELTVFVLRLIFCRRNEERRVGLLCLISCNALLFN